MGDEPAGPNTDEPCATNRSSDVGSITSFRRTPPPQVHTSTTLEEQAAPSSASASNPGPLRLPKPRMSKVSPVASVKPPVKSTASFDLARHLDAWCICKSMGLFLRS